LTRSYIKIDNLHFFEIWRHVDDTLVEAVVCEWGTGRTHSDTDDLVDITEIIKVKVKAVVVVHTMHSARRVTKDNTN